MLMGSPVLRVTRPLPLVRENEADAPGDFVRLDDDVTDDGVVERGGCCAFGSDVRPHTEGRPRLPNNGFEAWKETIPILNMTICCTLIQ